MFKARWYRIASLVVLVGAGCAIGSALVPEAAPVRVARAQANDDEFITTIFPIFKTIKDLGESLKALLPDTRSTTTTTSATVDSDASAPRVIPGSPVLVPDQSVAQKLATLLDTQRKRNPLIADLTRRYRGYVSLEIDRCKAALAAGEKDRAQMFCGLAQDKIAACQTHANEMNYEAQQLTARYEPTFGSAGRFGFLYCSEVTTGLSDPGALLLAADLQLPDGLCYAHTDRMVEFAKTGTMRRFGRTFPTMEGPITTPTEYLKFIQRKCTTRIGDEAVRALIEAESDQNRAAQAPLTDNTLPKRPDSGLASTFDEAIDEVDRQALGREPTERQASDASEKQAHAAAFAAAEKAERDRLAAEEAVEVERLATIERARLRQEFTRTLGTASDGELFALADEQKMAGDESGWRAALHALLSRFEKSPLLMAAAKALGAATAEAAVIPPPNPGRPAPSPQTSTLPSRGCVSLITDVINIMNEVPGRVVDPEQEVWRQQTIVRTVNAMPVCSAADRATGARGLSLAQTACRTARGADCLNGQNRRDDEARIRAAVQNAIRLASGGAAPSASAQPNANSSTGALPFEACVSGDSVAGEKLSALVAANAGDTTLITRGILATIDATRDSYRRCLPDPRARDKIDALDTTYNQTLVTCRQISVDANSCRVSPFR